MQEMGIFGKEWLQKMNTFARYLPCPVDRLRIDRVPARGLSTLPNACYNTPGGELLAYYGTRGKHLKAGNARWCNVLAADTLAAFGGDCLVVSTRL